MNTAVLENTDGYEFSENQKNLWKAGESNPEVYYHQILLGVNKDITPGQLKSAIRTVKEKHLILSFKAHADKNYLFPFQRCLDQSKMDFCEIESFDDDVSGELDRKLNDPYDAVKDEPIRFCSVKVEGKIKYLGIRLYALWGDIYSSFYFYEELCRAISSNLQVDDETEAIDYINFSAWQNDLLAYPEEEAVRFWKTYNAQKGREVIPLSTGSGARFKPGRRRIYSIQGDQYVQIKKYCAENSLNLSELLFHQWVSYLFSFTDEPVTFGFIPFNRGYQELRETLGYVNKTVPVKLNEPAGLSRIEILREIRNRIEEVENWADYFSLDRENISLKDGALFNYCYEFLCSGLNLDNNPGSEIFSVEDVYSVQDPFKLKLSCVDFGDKIEVALYYDEGKITSADLAIMEAQLAGRFREVDQEHTNAAVWSLPEKELIESVNRTEVKFDDHDSILDLFEDQVRRNPDRIAVVSDTAKITYSELNEKANRLASYLIRHRHIKKGDPICLLMGRSEWFVISALGVLKTGAYYVPIDHEYPLERINFILKDCNCKVLICHHEKTETFDDTEIPILSPLNDEIYKNAEAFHTYPGPSDVAYCIYTSGSTGNPKGCLISHGNLLNYVQWANEFYFGSHPDRGNWGLITSVSFDLSVTALFTSLTRGKKLWIGSESKDIAELLSECFGNAEIDALKLTPSHIQLLKELEIPHTNISALICGGEQLTKNHVRMMHEVNERMHIYNEYGPTEATVGCIAKEIDPEEDRILIGKPIANTTIAIVDDQGNPCSVGVAGEIVVFGSGISSGYLNRPELTAEKFEENIGDEGKRHYKTGDLGRWISDGNIEYIGRRDNQVKIKGFRIELGEIERQLMSKDSLDQAVVLVAEDGAFKKEMIAFIVSSENQAAPELREYLASILPEYMIPDRFIQLEKLPLTVNGKVDRHYLLSLGEQEAISETEYAPPRNEIEEMLVAIWEKHLNRKRIGIHDIFFNIGGDSIRGVRIVSEIQKLYHFRIDIATLFKNPTVQGLAEEIANHVWQTKEIEEERIVDKTII